MPESHHEKRNPFLRRFVFHGNAVAAGVILSKVGSTVRATPSPVHGQSLLPTVGGHSESFVPSSDAAFAEFFSYGECRTQADGVAGPTSAVTTVSASLENIRMVNRPSPDESLDPKPIEFLVGALSLKMRSTHGLHGHPSIEFVEKPVFERMSLDGRPIVVELRPEFLELTTMASLERRFVENHDFFLESHRWFMRSEENLPSFGTNIPRMNGYVVSSIVRRIHWGEQTIEGHVLYRKGFGSIYFGEVLMHEYTRRVTLVRVQMGSEVELRSSLVEGEANGTWWPPVS